MKATVNKLDRGGFEKRTRLNNSPHAETGPGVWHHELSGWLPRGAAEACLRNTCRAPLGPGEIVAVIPGAKRPSATSDNRKTGVKRNSGVPTLASSTSSIGAVLLQQIGAILLLLPYLQHGCCGRFVLRLNLLSDCHAAGETLHPSNPQSSHWIYEKWAPDSIERR